MTISDIGPVQYNPFLPEFKINPYPFYHQLRSFEPVHRFKTFRGHQWLLTRYTDVRSQLAGKALRIDDLPEQVKEKARYSSGQNGYGALIACVRHWLFFNDPPQHTRLRAIFGKWFTASSLQYLRSDIKRHAETLILPLLATGRIDIISDLAFPLPTITMAGMLGVRDGRLHEVSAWSTELFRILVPPQSIENLDRMNLLVANFEQYLTPLIEARSIDPKDDLLSQIVASRNEGLICQDETLALCIMLFSVGQETTENLIGNSILALVQHPEQWQLLRESPGLIAQAIDETARYDTPVQGVARIVAKDIEIGGVHIEKGERVILALAAALRDPEQYQKPDRLDITRNNIGKLPFGAGIHFCLGAHLAKLQAEVVLEVLLEHCEHLELAIEEPQWRSSVLLRGVKSLPLKIRLRGSSNGISKSGGQRC